jgi:hypothetical protein
MGWGFNLLMLGAVGLVLLTGAFVGGDHGQHRPLLPAARGHQRLAQLLPLHPAEERDLHNDADCRCRADAGQNRDIPGVRVGGLVHVKRIENRKTDIGADQVKRAMRHVHGAHETEYQGKPARHDEIQGGERDSVQRYGRRILQRQSLLPSKDFRLSRIILVSLWAARD